MEKSHGPRKSLQHISIELLRMLRLTGAFQTLINQKLHNPRSFIILIVSKSTSWDIFCSQSSSCTKQPNLEKTLPFFAEGSQNLRIFWPQPNWRNHVCWQKSKHRRAQGGWVWYISITRYYGSHWTQSCCFSVYLHLDVIWCQMMIAFSSTPMINEAYLRVHHGIENPRLNPLKSQFPWPMEMCPTTDQQN